VTLVAVVSDTHLPRGARALPQACVDLLAAADVIVHAGDVTSARVLETLAELGTVHAVRGNMDDAELQATLPERRVVPVNGVRIGVVHDAGPSAGRHARLAAAFRDCDAVVYGHTHLPELARHGPTWILNPGSPTERRRAPFRSLLALDVDGRRLRPRLVELP
jgi:putative phosphoesterase